MLCSRCLGSVEYPPKNICCVCGRGLDFDYDIETGDAYSCGECLNQPPAYEQLRHALAYSGPVRDIIHAFKFSGRAHLWRGLAALAEERLLDWLSEWPGAMVIPVPLAPRKLFTRGYNPPYLLARHFADKAGLVMADGAIRRIRATTPQFGLNAGERAENVKGAFAIHDGRALEGRRVILFDDIFTTGATVRECVKTIRKAKPEAVRVAALCRAGF